MTATTSGAWSHVRTFIVMVVLAALASGGYYGYRALNGNSAPATYRTVEARRQDILSTVSATGNIEPLVKVLVGSQVSGTVTKWYADFNQEIKQGFTLAQLDQDRFRASLQQREAGLAVASARREEAAARLTAAQLDLDRMIEVSRRNGVSDFELRTKQTDVAAAAAAVQAAEAAVKQARAELASASIELDRTIIKSPIDGVVIERSVDEGQTVAASLQAPTLFTIANDLRKMRVNAAVSETDIGRVRESMKVQFRVDAYPTRKFDGIVSQVRYKETIVDNVVTYTTLIDVNNDELLLRPGMTATILFEVEKRENVLAVPNAALRFDPGAASSTVDWMRPGRGRPQQPRVFKLDAAGALVEVPVELGLNDGSNTEIRTDAIQPGDKIVVEQMGGPGPGAAGPARSPMGGGGRGPRM